MLQKKLLTFNAIDYSMNSSRKSGSRKMIKCRKMVLFSCFVMLICCSTAWATAYDDDSQVESEAKRDMLAYVQSTFPSRFGERLQAGDYVQYEITGHPSQSEEPSLCSLEVTQRIGDVATIKEEFEGNILYYKIDLQSNTLLEYWGFDEEGTEQRPLLLSSSEVETRMQSIRDQNTRPGNSNVAETISKPMYSSLSQRESVTLARSSIDCFVKTLDVPDMEGLTIELKQAVQEMTKVLFSEAVPKLLPAKLMAGYLDNPEVFEGNAGLVKQSKYRIKDYNKVER